MEKRAMEHQLVVFNLANEQYGVHIGAVESIIKLQPITIVPNAPSFIVGVTNQRGRVLPVIDLRKRFGLPAAEPTRVTRLIVVALNAQQQVGMLVDSVSEVLRVAEENIEAPSPIVTTVRSAFVTGIAKVGERLIVLLSLEQVLSPEEQTDLESLQTDAAQAESAPVESQAEPTPAASQAEEAAPAQAGSRPRRRAARKQRESEKRDE